MKENNLLKKLLIFVLLDGVITTIVQYLVNQVLESYVHIKVPVIVVGLVATIAVLLVFFLLQMLLYRLKKWYTGHKLKTELSKIETNILKDFFSLRLGSATFVEDYMDAGKLGSAQTFRRYVKAVADGVKGDLTLDPGMDESMKQAVMRLTSLSHMKAFVEYVGRPEFDWNQKQKFVDEYRLRIRRISELCRQLVGEDHWDEAECASTILVYEQELRQNAMDMKEQYVPLSYRKSDSTKDTVSLEQLLELEEGIVLVADAGYGKTWSLREMAGILAERYLTNTDKHIPIFIEMGKITTNVAKPVSEAINSELFRGKLTDEKLNDFMQSHSLVLFIDGMDEALNPVAEMVRIELENLNSYGNLKICGGTRSSHRNKFPDALSQFDICDLETEELRMFIEKNVSAEYVEQATRDWITDEVSLFRNIKTPFYITSYCKAINSGRKPTSELEIIEFCVEGIIQRELDKGFRANQQIIRELLIRLCEKLDQRSEQEGIEVQFLPEMDTIREITDQMSYDTDLYASVPVIVDDLVELMILTRKESTKTRRYYIGFYENSYRYMFSLGEDDDLFQ